MKQLGYLCVVLVLLGLLPAMLPEDLAPINIATAQPADMPARTVTVQTGAGQDTVDPLAFLPEKVRIRVGDTVTWKMEGDIHTVSFTTGTKSAGLVIPSSQAAPGAVLPRVFRPVPGAPQGVNMMNPTLVFPTRKADQPVETYSGMGFVNSGMMSNTTLFLGTLPIQTFSVTFDTPGTFQYVCFLHQEFGMRGTVEVAPATATDVPSFNPARPAAVFDPAQVFNSGTIGTFPGPGMPFAPTFETSGIFKYFCGIHRDQGMEGTIIVQPRQALGL